MERKVFFYIILTGSAIRWREEEEQKGGYTGGCRDT